MDTQYDVPLVTAPPSHESVERVVLFTDMVSYSRRISEDEASTLEFMASCFDTLRILARRYNGFLVKTLGDGAMLLFDDCRDAIDYGVEFQRIVSKLQLNEPKPYKFRVGLHKGTVLLRNGDAYGNTVNIASRLETLAEPGRCVVSQIVYDSVHDGSDLQFEALGTPSLKNIREKIPLYRVVDQLSESSVGIRSSILLIRLMDGVEIDGTESPTGGRLSVDARIMLGYLALCAGQADSVDRIAALFGTDRLAIDRAESALKEIQDSEFAALVPFETSEGFVTLDPIEVETDLDIMVSEIRQTRVPVGLTKDADWPHRILSGLGGASPVFSGWLRVTRESWKRRILNELERLIERTLPAESAHEDAADAVLLLEPGNEVGALAKINGHMARSDQGAALAEFERLKHYLEENYGVSPGEQVRRAIQYGIEKGTSAVFKKDRPAPMPPRRLLRIAVDEFVGSDLPELQAFRGELIANLARFRDWSIIDGVDDRSQLDEIDYCIDGSTIRSETVLQIAIRLHEQASGRALWAESFPFGTKKWEQVQHGIIHKIAATIESYISADRLASAFGKVGCDPTSHDAWLVGDRAMMRWTPEGAKEARAVFEGILKHDPNHTPSLTSLASLGNIHHVIWPGQEPGPDEVANADRLASRAVELDPMDSRIQRVVAWSAAMAGSFARASMHMDLAASLNPNSPATLASCAMGFAWFGERDKAEATLTRLRVLGSNLPPWVWAYLASAYFFLDRLDDALEAAELGGDSIADTHGWRAAIHARRGESENAGAAFSRFFETVSIRWSGLEKATPNSVAVWFANTFPLRNAVDRGSLSEAIHIARMAS